MFPVANRPCKKGVVVLHPSVLLQSAPGRTYPQLATTCAAQHVAAQSQRTACYCVTAVTVHTTLPACGLHSQMYQRATGSVMPVKGSLVHAGWVRRLQLHVCRCCCAHKRGGSCCGTMHHMQHCCKRCSCRRSSRCDRQALFSTLHTACAAAMLQARLQSWVQLGQNKISICL